MKTFSKLYILAAAALGMTACNSDEDYLGAFNNDPNAVHFSVQIAADNEAQLATKVNTLAGTGVDPVFEANDKVAVSAGDQEAVTYTLTDGNWVPETGKYLIWSTETDLEFNAYYPVGANDASMTTFIQPGGFADEAALKAADYMTYTAKKSRKDGEKVTLSMDRKMARVIFEIGTVYNQYKKFTVNDIKMNINSVGYKDRDVETGEKNVTALKVGEKFYALVTPTTGDTKKIFLTIEGTADDATTPTTLEVTGIPEMKAGMSYTYTLNIGKDKATVAKVTVIDWKEGTITGGTAEEETNKSYPIIDPVNHSITTNDVDQFTTAQIDEALNGGTDLKIIGPITTKAKDLENPDYSDLYSQLSAKVVNLDLSEAEIESLPAGAFLNSTTKLASIILPESVKELPKGAFCYCNNLTKVTCKGDITNIGLSAFMYVGKKGGTSLTLYMMANTKSPAFTYDDSASDHYRFTSYFDTYTFVDVYVKNTDVRNDFLKNYTWDNGGEKVEIGIPATADAKTNTLTLYDGGLFEDADLTTALAGGTSLKVVGPMSTSMTPYLRLGKCVANLDFSEATNMSEIPLCAFDNSTTLESIILPTSTNKIGVQAFSYCTNLTSVTFLGQISSIGEKAFYNCNNLATVDFSAFTYSDTTGYPTLDDDAFTGAHNDKDNKVTVVRFSSAAEKNAICSGNVKGWAEAPVGATSQK